MAPSTLDSAVYRHSFSIAGISLQIETDQQLAPDNAFSPFLAKNTTPDFTARFHCVDALPPFPESVRHEDLCYRVHSAGDGSYVRTFFDEPGKLPTYAVAVQDYERRISDISYLNQGAYCVSEMANTFFHLDLADILIHFNRICFHASCISTALGGILFSGPSGIGKSTQAALWCSHRDAVQINGDRPILSKSGNGWLAWGSPYAGSSRCHVNSSCPVTAVVMLRQAPVCSLRKLTLPEAFRAVWSGLTVHDWDPGFMETSCDLTMDLIRSVPVYEFCCTPDERAVSFLEQQLRKERRI